MQDGLSPLRNSSLSWLLLMGFAAPNPFYELRPEKVMLQCELSHRQRPSCLLSAADWPLVRAFLNCASGVFAFRNLWVIAMGVFHRTAMLCSWFIESTMSGCTERFRVR